MDYKRVLRLHFVNHLSGREIAESCGDCSKTTVNEFLKISPSPSTRSIIACPGNICDRNLRSGQGKKKSMSITNTVTSSGRISGATHRKTG